MSYLFDCYSKVYDCFMRWMHLDNTNHVLAEIKVEHNRILDIGGGTGTLADILVKSGKDVTILDPSIPMTDIARRKNVDIEIINQRLDEFTSVKKYDCVILKDCLHHIQNQSQAIYKCGEITEQNGIILIQEFFPYKRSNRALFLFERCCFEKIVPVEIEGLLNLLELNGFQVQLKHITSKEYMVIGRHL